MCPLSVDCDKVAFADCRDDTLYGNKLICVGTYIKNAIAVLVITVNYTLDRSGDLLSRFLN